jgi:hypothetical protein
MLAVDFSILNQKATPAIYADTLANRPAANFAGRLFVATDSPYGVFRDTGAAWVQVASNGGGGGSTGVNGLNGTTNIGLGGTLANNTTIAGSNFNLLFTGNNILQQTCKVFNLNCTDLSSNTSQINAGNGNYLILSQQNSVGTNSNITIEPQKIISKFNSANYGLSLDDSTGKFVLGDYNNDRKYNSFVVNDDDDKFYITTSYNQTNTDQDLFFVSNKPGTDRFVKLGDFNSYNNDYALIIDDENQFIKTTNSTGDYGFIINNTNTILGSYNSTQYLFLNVDSNNNEISTHNSLTTSNGISLDFAGLIYRFGGFNANQNFIQIDDTNNFIDFQTTELIFTGAALESSTAGGNSGQHLVITLNGNQYKIKLENP